MMRGLVAVGIAVACLCFMGCSSDETDFSGAGSGGGSGAPGGTGGSEGGEGGSASSDDSLEDVGTVRGWANLASALAVYVAVYQPIAVADGEATFADATCPTLLDDGTTLEITGGCTDASGQEWVGVATIVRSGDGDRDLTLDGFGTPLDLRTGEAQVRRIDEMTHAFDVDLVHETDAVATYDYSGEVSGGYDMRTVWSGSGTVTREGGQVPTGRIEATTTNEVVDDAACSGQPASGNTTLRDRHGNTAVVTYDGSVDCDDEQTASYTLNGEPEREITGIACSASPGRRGNRPAGVLGVVLALAALAGSRRRTSRRAPARATSARTGS
jgi:hypothetical protein